MREDGFYICEEDNVFDVLSSLYEDLKPSPYADALDLDPNLGWQEEVEYQDLPFADIKEDYGTDLVEFQRGDILVADLFQYGRNINLDHIRRPLLVIYANAFRVYGFQLTTSHPASLLDYLVEVPNYTACNLRFPSSFNTASIVSVERTRLVHRVGHITEEQKQAILDKLHELKAHLDILDTYGWWTQEKLDRTITNLSQISC